MAAEFEEFALWTAQYLATPGANRKALSLTEGIRLARARRAALAKIIRSNPRQALQWAAPWRWYQELPTAITSLLEEQPNGRGRLDVYCALPLPGADYQEFEGGTIRYVTLDHRNYRAYVYGRRRRQMSCQDAPLHGIAVDRVMALSEDPLRVLSADETQAARLAGKTTTNAACAHCGTSSIPSGAVVLADYGGQLLSFCGTAHASEMNCVLAKAETALPKTTTLSQSGGQPPPPNLVFTFGTKRVIYLRVVFTDDSEVPISEAEATDVMDKVNDFYIEASYNKTALISTISPVLTLPQTKMYYAVEGPGTLAQDAREVARAAGFEPNDYDLVLIRHTNVPGFTWGGLGGGGTAWLQSSGAGVAAHEIGHNYGLAHANFWTTRRDALPPNPNNLPFDTDSLVGHDSIIGAGDDVAYGDPYDVMGSGGGESPTRGVTNIISSLNGHFNPVGKFLLGWLPASYITAVDQSSTNRIYVHDSPTLVEGRAYALNVRKDEDRTYWVSARSRFPDNTWLQNGLELHWGPWEQALGYSQLLDTTPGSGPGQSDGAIVIGRTYSDWEANIHITPIDKGGVSGDTWFDVVVNFGPFPNNVAPLVEVTISADQTGVGVPVTFSASASDENRDRLAYYWDFGDGTYGTNTALVSKAWASEGDYVVRCEVSDMKGGVTSKHFVVRVGAPATLRISGTVMDTFGNPLAGVRVSNGSLTNNDLAPDYQWTYTDSDGAFTLANLSTNSAWSIGAYLNGYVTQPLNFTPPISLTDQDAVNALFQAQPLPQVTVQAGADANKSPVKPGSFALTRTGDTNTAFSVVFLLAGTAGPGDYAAYTNTMSQTNINPNPFGPVTNIVPFLFVSFPTGVVTTNIVIAPSTNAASGPDKYVELAIMNALQAQRIGLTNTNWVSFTGWEIRTIDGRDTWFQTDPDYVPGSAGVARVWIRGPAPTLPSVSIVASDSSASENKNDSGLFTLTRFGRLDLPVTVSLTVSGTANSGSDYEGLPATVTIPAGETVLRLPVYVRPNQYLDGNKTVTVTLAKNSNYLVGSSTATVTIMDNDPPLVTIVAIDDSISEASTTPAGLLVTRTGDFDRDLVVNYLVTGTAISGQDYRALPGSVTIPAGQPSATVSVAPRNNNQKEGDLTVVVFISDSPTYNVGFPNSATVVIQDAAVPTVTINATVATASEGGTPGEFTVTRTGSLNQNLWVDFLAGGTAKPLADYAGIGNRVLLPAGSNQAIITITAVSDQFVEEPAETVTLELVPSTNYNVGNPGQATVTITDNNSGLPAVGFAQLTSSVPESISTGQVAVVVSANPPENGDVTVDYKITGGTAVAGVDYPATNATGRLVFPHNPRGGENAYLERVKLISIPILDNTNAQPNRTIVLTLLDPAPDMTNEIITNIVQDPTDPTITTTNYTTNLIVTPVPKNAYFDVYKSHTLTILDDDASVVTVEATIATANEAGPVPGVFTIRRTRTSGTQKVFFSLAGSAVNGHDYQQIDSPIAFPDGAASVTIPIMPIDDAVQEYMEDVTITLLSAPGAQVGDGSTATINIIDANDGAIEFIATAFSVPENIGIAQIPVRRTGDTTSVASVEYFIAPGTATGGLDFVATNGILTFYPGDSLKYVPVTILDDNLVEPAETINLTLRNAGDGAPLGGQDTALLTILDDDTAVEFTQAAFRINENATNALITAHRIGITTNVFAVDFMITNAFGTNGIAQAGRDYVATNGTLHFGPGQTEASFQVHIFDNAVLDGNKTAQLVLANPTDKVSLGPQNPAALVIVDDDCYLEFVSTARSIEEYARTIAVTIRRVGGTVNAVTVDYATQAGTAKPNKDYLSVAGTLAFSGDSYVPAQDGSGNLVFQPGDTKKIIQIPILDNTVGDGDRQFYVNLINPHGPANALPGATTLGANTNLAVTILDDEKPGNVDYAFNPGQGADQPVRTVALQPDGKVLFGGEFTLVDDVILNHVARLHTDGFLDSFLNPGEGADNTVFAVAIQPNGRVLIGGDFAQVNGVARTRLARLNIDGSLDDSFDPGISANATVRAIAVQPDGGILIGGDFTQVGGVDRNGVARLNQDGTIDSAFNPGTGATGGSVLALVLQPDGNIILGGSFLSLAGLSSPYLARLDTNGSPDATFNPAGRPDRAVRALALQADGHLVIGGDFTLFAGSSRKGIARLNRDGSLDASFDPGTGANDTVFTVGMQADGKVIVGGVFTNLNGVALNRLARLNTDGSIDDTFDIGSGANDAIRALVVQPDTAIVVGGDFTTVRDVPRNHIARIHGDDKYVFNRVQFVAADYTVLENVGQAAITVTRSGNTNSAISLGFLTADGTALAGANYIATNGTLSFGAGETVKTFNVLVLNDGAARGDLTVKLLLTNIPSGFSLNAQLTATLTIQDLAGKVTFAAANYSVNESDGLATITVQRTGISTNVVTVDYVTQDGTAIRGLDYTAVSGTLTFAAGVTNQTFTIPILNDNVPENDETVLLTLSHPQGGPALGQPSTAVLAIHDDDQGPFYRVAISAPVGGVVSPPAGLYPAGSIKAFTATANPDFEFVQWEGTTNSSLPQLVLVINQDYVLTAVFRAKAYTYTFRPPFAAAELTNNPWSSFGDMPWQLQTLGTNDEPPVAVRSGAIGDSEQSGLALTLHSRTGAASFDVRVSSEEAWDFLEFSINGNLIQKWSGEVPWQSFVFNLTAGTNRLVWRYVKDKNFSAGLDAAFIDNIYVPIYVPPAVLAVAWTSNNTVQVQLKGEAGQTYVLQASSDLMNWHPVATNQLSTTAIFITDPESGSLPRRFYRAISP